MLNDWKIQLINNPADQGEVKCWLHASIRILPASRTIFISKENNSCLALACCSPSLSNTYKGGGLNLSLGFCFFFTPSISSGIGPSQLAWPLLVFSPLRFALSLFLSLVFARFLIFAFCWSGLLAFGGWGPLAFIPPLSSLLVVFLVAFPSGWNEDRQGMGQAEREQGAQSYLFSFYLK